MTARRALHVPGVVCGGPTGHATCSWTCSACGEQLAEGYSGPRHVRADGIQTIAGRTPTGNQVVVAPGLEPLPAPRDGVAAFAVPDRVRLHGRQPYRPTRVTAAHELPIFVYCPHRGCGAGQRLDRLV